MDSDLYVIIVRIVELLALPTSVVIAAFVLRPILKSFFNWNESRILQNSSSLKQIDLAGASKEYVDEGNHQLHNITEPRDKIEKLRLILENEQIKQLIQYHANGLLQSQVSFWFSIGAACLGFIVIIMGLLTIIFFDSSSAYSSILSGAIIDAVAALFFAQSNQARKLMTDFFDKLRVDRQFNESLRLCESISDQNVQSLLKARLSLFLAGFTADDNFVNELTALIQQTRITSSNRPDMEAKAILHGESPQQEKKPQIIETDKLSEDITTHEG